MAVTDDIQAKLIQIANDIVSERTEVQSKISVLQAQVTALEAQVATLQAQIAALQTQLADGTVIPNASLAEVSATLDLIDTNVKLISEPEPPA